MSMNSIAMAALATGALLLVSSAPGVAGQAHDPQHAATDKAKPPSGMAAKDHAMMADHEKMMADMKAADQRLDSLVATMNTASGPEKMAATATVVTEMVTQQRTMHEGMMKMEQGMMTHMMEHMAAGNSMAMCPMMTRKDSTD